MMQNDDDNAIMTEFVKFDDDDAEFFDDDDAEFFDDA